MARFVTVGGSVAALSAALLLARRGHEVTLLERDPAGLPGHREDAWAGWSRPGVPHFRQLHIYNGLGRRVLREQLPDVHAAWLAAGAFETPLLADEPDVVRTNCRRTTFEWVLRTAAATQPGVTLRTGVTAISLLCDSVGVTGVVTDQGPVAADLVIDASGRQAVSARWHGGGVTTTQGRCGTVAATRWYRLGNGDMPGQLRADLGYAACVLVPTDGGMFSVTFGYQGTDTALKRLRTVDGFSCAAAVVEPIAAWVDPSRSEPVTAVLARGDGQNRLRRITGLDAPAGLVLLGDAAICTNPGYGRGIGMALSHAAHLAAVVDRTGADPAATTEAFEQVTASEHAPWFHAAVASDRARRQVASRSIAGEPLSDIGGPGDDPEVRFARCLPQACAAELALNRTFQRVWHLLDPPSALWGDPAIRARVDTYGPSENAGGPDHATMAALLRH